MKYFLLFFAVLLGYIIARLLKKSKHNGIPFYLAFSGGYLLSITVLELLPGIYTHTETSIGIFIMIGIMLQICLEFFSKGAEHGHIHIHLKENAFPYSLLISLSVHALLEGFPIDDHNHVLVGILVHKIPVAIILSLFFIKENFSIFKTTSFLFVFACMTPLGMLLKQTIPQLLIYEREINALVVGVLLHVSTTILFESSKDHKFNIKKVLAIVLGISIAYFL